MLSTREPINPGPLAKRQQAPVIGPWLVMDGPGKPL